MGEGVFSLSRGFAAAGIPSSVSTLWAVEEQASYAITERFLDYLRKGEIADVALQKAKLDMLRIDDGKFFLPYFWGANILIGNPNVEYDMERSSFSIYLIFMVIAITGMVLFVYNLRK